MINGCFWHRHNCHMFKWPKTRQQFWREKIESNQARDKVQMERLLAGGWRVIVVWECAIKGRERLEEQALMDLVVDAIRGQTAVAEITGSRSPNVPLET